MPAVLSTKKLSKIQKAPLLKNGFELSEHEFINIEPLDFGIPKKVENAIFTSQNAVKQVMGYGVRGMSCYCVGEKTKTLLEKQGLRVKICAEYGQELGKKLVEQYAGEHFTFFCGNRRRHELPAILRKNRVSFEEVAVYKTILRPKHFEQKFDAALFFSPSGVQGFCSENELNNTMAFCIGKTTASEARKLTDKIIVSEMTTVESLVEAVGKYFN